jgi:erythromycin esterase
MTRTFYSADPLAKAASKKEMDLCWLDFGKVPGDSVLRQDIDGYIFMGSLGEAPGDGANGIVYSLLPQAYRIWQSPSQLYDGMIFVREAHPTEIE